MREVLPICESPTMPTLMTTLEGRSLRGVRLPAGEQSSRSVRPAAAAGTDLPSACPFPAGFSRVSAAAVAISSSPGLNWRWEGVRAGPRRLRAGRFAVGARSVHTGRWPLDCLQAPMVGGALRVYL